MGGPVSLLRRCLAGVALSFFACFASLAFAQDAYPSRPIKLVVPYPAGALTDLLARAIGDRLAAALKQPVVVDNKPGAGTLLGAEFVAKQPPDGYTLLMATSAAVPPVAATVPGYDWRAWQGIVAPAGTPVAIIDRLAAEMQKIQVTPEFKEQLYRFAMEPFAPNTPAEFAAVVVAEQPRWAKAVEDSGSKVE